MGPLKNNYWVLRHGRSKANEAGIIVSSPVQGAKEKYGLAPEGFAQAELAGATFAAEWDAMGKPEVIVVSSPFSRTMDTAQVFLEKMGLPMRGPSFRREPLLRERYFGEALELGSHDRYSDVWMHDEQRPGDPPPFSPGAESVADVARRVGKLLGELESDAPEGGWQVVLIGHGDTLQITQTLLAGAPVRLQRHREFAMETGELRHVVIPDDAEVDLDLPP